MSGFAGTPGYLSPEVLRKDAYGKPVDVWACGRHRQFMLGVFKIRPLIFFCSLFLLIFSRIFFHVFSEKHFSLFDCMCNETHPESSVKEPFGMRNIRYLLFSLKSVVFFGRCYTLYLASWISSILG